MASSMDPRRRPQATQQKRQASQSPDGAVPSKINRPSPFEGSSTLQHQANGSSRQSSISLDPRPAARMHQNQINGSRRPPAQPPYETRKDNDALGINSPDSLGSKRSNYEDAPSGRSTPTSASAPQPQPRPAPPPPAQMNGIKSTEPSPNGVYKLLITFQDGVMNATLSMHAKKQREAAKQKADKEHRDIEKHFKQFPAIMESNKAAVEKADKDLKAVNKIFQDNQTKQQELAGAIAALIQPDEKKPADSRAAPPAESSLPLGEVEQLRSTVEKLQKQLEESASAVATANTKIEELEQKLDLVETKATKALTQSGQEPAFHSSIKKLQESTEKHGNNIASLQKTVKSLSGGSDSGLPQKQATDQLVTDFPKLADKVEGIGRKLGRLEDFVGNNKANAGADEASSGNLSLKVSQLERDAKDTKISIDALDNDVKQAVATHQAPAQGSVNLEPVYRRLRALEEYDERLVNETLPAKDEAICNFADEVAKAKVEEHMAAYGQQLQELDRKIGLAAAKDTVDTSFANFTVAFTEMQNKLPDFDTMIQGMKSLHTSLEGLKKTMADLGFELGNKYTKNDGVKLEQEISALKDAVKKANAANVTRTPTPAPTQAQPQHRMTNGVNGGGASPAVNGFTGINGYHPTPQPNGTPLQPPFPHSPPIQGPISMIQTNNMHPDVSDAIRQILNKHDQLSFTLRQLGTRFDNLTTDDLAKCMLDQFASIWPYAKDYDYWCQDFNGKITTMELAVGDLQKKVEQVNFAASSAATVGGEAKEEIAKHVQKVGEDLEAINTQLADFKTRLAKGEAAMEALTE